MQLHYTTIHKKWLLSMYFVVNGLFSYINVSQGSVETYARSDGIFNKSFYCKFTKKSSSEKIVKIG